MRTVVLSLFGLSVCLIGTALAADPGTADAPQAAPSCATASDEEPEEVTIDLDQLSNGVSSHTIGCGKAVALRIVSTSVGALVVALGDNCAGTDSTGGILEGSALSGIQTFPDGATTERTFSIHQGTRIRLDCNGSGSGCEVKWRAD